MMMMTYKELVQSSVTASEVKWVVKWVTMKFLWMKWSELQWSTCAIDLILRVLDYIVTISFGYILYCVCFHLYCGCFKLFCNAWVYVYVWVL